MEADRIRLMALAFGRAPDVLDLRPEQRERATAVLLTELRAEDDAEPLALAAGAER